MASPWIKMLEFKIHSNAVDSVGRGLLICTLTDELRKRCDCTWTRYEVVDRDLVRIQHGENPEHIIECPSSDFDDWCSRGHVATLCAWATRIIEYAHPKLVGV